MTFEKKIKLNKTISILKLDIEMPVYSTEYDETRDKVALKSAFMGLAAKCTSGRSLFRKDNWYSSIYLWISNTYLKRFLIPTSLLTYGLQECILLSLGESPAIYVQYFLAHT